MHFLKKSGGILRECININNMHIFMHILRAGMTRAVYCWRSIWLEIGVLLWPIPIIAMFHEGSKDRSSPRRAEASGTCLDGVLDVLHFRVKDGTQPGAFV